MKEIRIKLDEYAKMPTRAHDLDAGLDIYARTGNGKYNPYRDACNVVRVPAHGSATFDTGVHVEIPQGYVGMLKSKSGLNVWSGIVSEGVIDAGYTGSITVKLYNHSDEDYFVKDGDKISQLVIMPIVTPTPVLVDSLEETERGDGGFGSTGR